MDDINDIKIGCSTIDSFANKLLSIGFKKIIDGGDHQITIWKEDGRRKIMVQGTGMNVTVLSI